MIPHGNQWGNPPDMSLLISFSFLFIVGLFVGLNIILTNDYWIRYFLGFIAIFSLGGASMFVITVFIVLRPIKIQIDEPGVILFYHFRKPVYVTWDMIEWVTRYDPELDSIMNKINRGGKMKIKFQRFPFFMPFDVAKAIMGAYKGNGRLRGDGRNSIIE